MFVYEVTMTSARGVDSRQEVRASDAAEAFAKAEAFANARKPRTFEAWRARRVGIFH